MSGRFMAGREGSLVVGADGQLGRALSDQLGQSGERLVETTRRSNTVSASRVLLDLGTDRFEWPPPRGVSVAYLCQAVSSIEQCRRAPEASALVNVINTVRLARSLVEAGAFVVFLSSNHVFDGSVPQRTAADPVSPRSEYGRQKAEAERQLLALGDQVAVVRLTKVLHRELPLFRQWIGDLGGGKPIRAFADMVMAPVPLPFVVQALQGIARARLPGIVQVSGQEDVTYAEAAHHLARGLKADVGLVQPALARESGVPAEVTPLHTTLDTSRLRTKIGMEPPSVWQTIDTLFELHDI